MRPNLRLPFRDSILKNDEEEAWKIMFEKAVAFLSESPLVSPAELDVFLLVSASVH